VIVGVAVGVRVPVGVADGVRVWVGVAVGVLVVVGRSVGVLVAVGVAVPVSVGVAVAPEVGVEVGVPVGETQTEVGGMTVCAGIVTVAWVTVIWFWPGHSFPDVGIWTAITIPADAPTGRLVMCAWNVVAV
jgi:hypothetical protein